MKKLAGITVAVATLTALSAFTPGKEKTFEGKVVYEITYDEVPEMLEPYISMMPKENISYVKGSKVRIESGSMGVNTVTVFDSKKNEGFTIMEGMGMEKTAYTMDPKDVSAEKANAEKPIVIPTKETKTISGYECKKELYVMPSDTSDTLVAYVTTKISGKNFQYNFLSGFPMQYQQKKSGMSTTVTVKEILEQKVNDSFFKIPDGVPTKPYSDLLKMLGGLGGGEEEDNDE